MSNEFKKYFDLKEILEIPWNLEGVSGFRTGWFLNYADLDSVNISKDLFLLNANRDKYLKYIENSFYKNLEYILKSESFAKQHFPYFYLEEDKDGNKKIYFSFIPFYNFIFDMFSLNKSENEYNSIEEYFSELKNALKEERKKFNCIKNGELESDIVYDDYLIFKNSIEKEYSKIVSFDVYLNKKIRTLTSVITSIKYLIPFFKKEIELEDILSFIDYEKLCLSISYCFITYLEKYEKYSGNINSCIYYLENYLYQIKYFENDKKCSYNCEIIIENNRKFSVKELQERFQKLKDSHPEYQPKFVYLDKVYKYLEQNEFDYEYFSNMNNIEVYKYLLSINDYIENNIKKSIDLGAEIIKNDEMISTIEELQKEINSGNLSLIDYKKKKHQLQKLKMVFEEVKPKAIQKGIGVFKDFNVYYYQNGMVAIDKIDYGARLFVMPITIYKYIIENKINSLRAIGNLQGVKAFKHDDRTDWLINAKDYILNGCELVTEEDIKINERMTEWEFSYSEKDLNKINDIISNINSNNNYTDSEKQIKTEKINEKVEKIKREIEIKIKKSKEIDEELKKSNPESDLRMSERTEIKNCEELLDNELGYESDFQQLYEKVKSSGKIYKRNPAVAKYCKDRTIDANNMYHCEMCDKEYAIEEKSRLDFHHLVPIAENGPDTIYNGLCLCTECHRIIHFEKERITSKVKIYFLSKIEKHLKDENPEYLEAFYNYRKTYFPTINNLIYDKRNEIKQELENDGYTIKEYGEDIISDEIDRKMKKFEKLLEEDYKQNPDKYNEGFEIDWSTERNMKR